MNCATVSYEPHKLYAWVPELPLPDRYRDRLESMFGGRRDLLVVLVVVGIVVAGVLVLRFRTPPPLIAPPSTEAIPTGSASPTATPTETPTGELFVHVAGAVRRPGLYTLQEGSRVADAIEAAGGAVTKADLDAINLAELLVDGAKIDVPERGADAAAAQPAATPSTGSAAATPAPAIIDLNTADATMLETIPGIGPVLATAIVQHRDENGPFPSVDALIDVSGIGPATLESVRPYVTV